MSYKTIKDQKEATLVVKKSKFIGHIKPVSSCFEAEEFISGLKKKYWNATHNVFGYIIKNGNIKRCSDDGEPRGTAGIPVLNVIEKLELVDVCLVVTRYFGGTMLGAGGLVRAYGKVAGLTFQECEILTFEECIVLELVLEYSVYDNLFNILNEYRFHLDESLFEEKIRLRLFLLKGAFEKFLYELNKISCGAVEVKIIKEIHYYLK